MEDKVANITVRAIEVAIRYSDPGMYAARV